MFRELGINCFQSVWLYDYATRTVVKSDEVKRYGRLKQKTHTVRLGKEVWDIVANQKQVEVLLKHGYELVN